MKTKMVDTVVRPALAAALFFAGAFEIRLKNSWLNPRRTRAPCLGGPGISLN